MLMAPHALVTLDTLAQSPLALMSIRDFAQPLLVLRMRPMFLVHATRAIQAS